MNRTQWWRVFGMTVVGISLLAAAIPIVRAAQVELALRRTIECGRNLRTIDEATMDYVMANQESEYAHEDGPALQAELISPYISGGFESVVCPDGGEYFPGPAAGAPRCSHPAHDDAIHTYCFYFSEYNEAQRRDARRSSLSQTRLFPSTVLHWGAILVYLALWCGLTVRVAERRNACGANNTLDDTSGSSV